MIWPSMRFDISLQNFKKPLDDILSPQIERKNVPNNPTEVGLLPTHGDKNYELSSDSHPLGLYIQKLRKKMRDSMKL